MTLKDMVKIKVKIIIYSSLETIQFCYWTFSPKCILTEDIRGGPIFFDDLYNEDTQADEIPYNATNSRHMFKKIM